MIITITYLQSYFIQKYVGIMNGIVLMMGNGISPCYFTFLRGGSHHQYFFGINY